MGCGSSTRSGSITEPKQIMEADDSDPLLAIKKLSAQRFTKMYMSMLLIQQERRDPAIRASRIRRRHSFLSGKGKPAPGFPEGGLAFLQITKKQTFLKHSHSPTMGPGTKVPMWINVSTKSTNFGGSEDSSNTGNCDQGKSCWPSLQAAYAQKYQNMQPLMIHKLRKARAMATQPNEKKNRPAPAFDHIKGAGTVTTNVLSAAIEGETKIYVRYFSCLV
jgi:hypothetical protein